MKATKILSAAVIIVAAAMLTGCGGSKKVTPSGSTKGTKESAFGTEIELNEAQKLAEKSPATRAWGEAVDFDLSSATAYAEAEARGKFARAIASHIKAAERKSGFSYQKASASETEGASVTDNGSKNERLVMSVAEELVENTVTIKTVQYFQPNRQYHVFVCLEYQGGASKLAQQISDKVKQRISDDERLKMNFEFEKFRQAVDEELKSMRNE